MKRYPKSLSKVFDKFRTNPLNRHISKKIKNKGSWAMCTPFPDSVKEEYVKWERDNDA